MNKKQAIIASLLLSCSIGLHAAGKSLRMSNVSVRQAMTELRQETGYSFIFAETEVNVNKKVSVNATSVRDAVDQILEGQPVTYEIKGKSVVVSRKGATTPPRTQQQAQTKRNVTGTVVDNNGDPVIGATVMEKGTQNGTVTDMDGRFKLSVSQGAQIAISYIGFTSQTLRASDNMKVTLQQEDLSLNDVVVIGYGTAKRSDLTGSLSQVSSKSFQDQNVTTLDQVLQGRAAGVQVSNTMGAPGSDVRIRVRGANSILGDNSPLFVIDGFVGADFNTLNPNDIESIEVLKDASSTAIYGSRGANGVILVTTRRGSQDDRVTLNYKGTVSVSSQLKKFDMLSAGDFARYANLHDEEMGLTNRTFTDQQIQEFDQNGGFDYQDAIFHTAVSQQHQLSVSGGNKKTQYRVSGNYVNNNGIVRKSSYERFTFRANLNTKVNDKLSFRFIANGSSNTGRNNGGYGGSTNIVTQMMSWEPTTNPYDGEGGFTLNDPVGSIKTNPLSLIYDSENINKRQSINVLGGVTYEIIPGLKLDLQAIMDLRNHQYKGWSGNYVSNYNPSASKSSDQSKMIQTTSQLTYDKTFGIHHINATAVMETQKYRWDNLDGSASGLKFPELKYDNLAMANSTNVGSDYSAWQLLSFIGRINYTLKDRYLASFSIRRDGSSKFAKDNRYSTFPAGAIAWNAQEEEFIKNLNIFSKLKLRFSWGLTGSEAISPYATLSGYNSGIYYMFDTNVRTNGIQMDNPGNKDLKWATTYQKDLGLALGFFDSRLNISFDYFIKNTRDLLLNKSVPYFLGGGSQTANVGKMRNNGFELDVNADIIRTKDWGWNTNVNFSYVKNEVRSLGDEQRIFNNANASGWNGQPEFVYEVGHPMSSLWGLKYLGPWKQSEAEEAAKFGCKPGDAHYEDLDGNYAIDGNDDQIIGCALPKYTLGWNNSVTYKNFTLNAFFQGVFGIDKLNYTRMMAIAAQHDARYATIKDVKDVWQAGTNENAWFPAWSPTSKWEPASTMNLENASFFRLKNLSLAYDFDIKNLAHLRLEAGVTNLFTITGYKGNDPEASNYGGGTSDVRGGIDYGAYPNSRTWTFGVNITF